MTRMRYLLATLAAGLLVAVLPGPVMASDVAVPTLVLESTTTDESKAEADLDLVHIVQTAAKNVTTVQEAPAIVTVISRQDLGERRQASVRETLDLVPGWDRWDNLTDKFPTMTTRGVVQAMLPMQDGLALADPWLNIASVESSFPMERLSRIEVITGPGGVLWGANSFLGIVNFVSKDAEDVPGVEVSAGYGSGQGDMDHFRAYAMAGITKLHFPGWKLFLHARYDRFDGSHPWLPHILYNSPWPQPTSRTIAGPRIEADPPTSQTFVFDGKLTMGKVNVRWSVPSYEVYRPATTDGSALRENWLEDALPECSQVSGDDPGAGNMSDACADRTHTGRASRVDLFDRYAVAQYKTSAIDLKAYGVEFVRRVDPILPLGGTKGLLEGGMGFKLSGWSYRMGTSADGSVRAGRKFVLLYGAEAFREWLPDSTTRSRMGGGVEATFTAPIDLAVLPITCPHLAEWSDELNGPDPASARIMDGCPITYTYATDRTVLGAYTAAEWRVLSGLIVSGGARYQGAPAAWSERPYKLERPLVSGAVVYRFLPGWHVKLNYAEGFRPPVFQATDTGGAGIGLKGGRNLVPETSQAMQAEVNARVLRGRGGIKELSLRSDYSYTVLRQLIGWAAVYKNAGTRGIHSVESLARLRLKGGHWTELGYTFLKTAMDDDGTGIAAPEHWFHLAVFLSLPKNLDATGVLRVRGSSEDPNRRFDFESLEASPYDQPDLDPRYVSVANVTDLVIDRLPAAASLEVGARYHMLNDSLILEGTIYNAFDANNYRADAQQQFVPITEILAYPVERFRAVGSATYRF